MTLELEENRSLVGLTAQQKAELVPRQYFEAITGSTSSLEPALIFTPDNLLTIKRYASVVRRLPPDQQSLASVANFELLGVNAEHIHAFYEDLRMHVAGWNVLEAETKTLGTQLENFASNFTSDGEKLLSIVRGSAAAKLINSRLQDVDEDELELIQPTRLEAHELSSVTSSVGEYLAVIEEDVSLAMQRISAVKERANRFARDVVDNLRPKAEGLVQEFVGHGDQAHLQAVNNMLGEIDQLIAEKNSEYKSLVGYTLAGLWFGPVGVAITGGIYGPEAERVRKEKNQLIGERERLTADLAQLSPEVGKFENTRLLIHDVEARLVDVETAAKNLEDVWNMLGVYTDESRRDLQRIDTDVSLTRFAIRFERVLRPWGNIRNISRQLSETFNETLKTYQEEI